MPKPFIFRRPGESHEDAERRVGREAAEADQGPQSVAADDEEIRPELTGAPSRYAELQALAQAAHPVVLGSEDRIVFKHGDLVGEWMRGDAIDGTGPVLGYYYQWVESGPVVARFTGQAD